MIIDIINV